MLTFEHKRINVAAGAVCVSVCQRERGCEQGKISS